MTPHQAKLLTLRRERFFLVRYKKNGFGVYRVKGAIVHNWDGRKWHRSAATAEEVNNHPSSEPISRKVARHLRHEILGIHNLHDGYIQRD